MKIFAFIMALYMTLGSLIPRTDFSQLLHIADLMEHYELHQQEATVKGKDFSTWDFFQLHFLSLRDHEHDNSSEHDKLPGHCFHNADFLFNIALESFLPQLQVSDFFHSVIYENDFHLNGFTRLLTQPPSFR